MKSFAPNYDEYMSNFGMPGFVIAMVKASSETIYVTDYGNDTYHMKNAEGKSPTSLILHFKETIEGLFRGCHRPWNRLLLCFFTNCRDCFNCGIIRGILPSKPYLPDALLLNRLYVYIAISFFFSPVHF